VLVTGGQSVAGQYPGDAVGERGGDAERRRADGDAVDLLDGRAQDCDRCAEISRSAGDSVRRNVGGVVDDLPDRLPVYRAGRDALRAQLGAERGVRIGEQVDQAPGPSITRLRHAGYR
jgi:hypothetical protein